MDVLIPEIFDENKILSGVTKINKTMFPETGLSLAPADILTDDEFRQHLTDFSTALNVGIERIKFNHQIHSDIIHVVDENSIMQDGDALITNHKGLLIYVKIADCAAILMHDTENNVIAAVHSGWRGTKQYILPKTIAQMIEKFGTKAENLKIFLSPMAQQKNYEVQSEFLGFFPNSVYSDNQGKYFFSNSNELNRQLLDAGIESEQIEVSDICTIENKEYHSFRRDGRQSGRMAAYIMLN